MNTNNVPILENVNLDFLNKKAIHSFTPFTLLDYPDKSACILWFAGCNMKCDYCYNPEIVFGKGMFYFSEIISFLKSRRNLLDAVVFSGGECLIHKDIIPFIKLVKSLGFLIKVDTNGSQPKVLEKLIKEQLIDYVALDFKGTKEKFFAITKSDFYSQFISCFELLQNSSIPFEIRTTYHSSLLNPDDIASMQNVLVELGYDKTYFIQNFRNYQNTIAPLPDSQSISEKDIHQNMTKIIFR
ncbi:anaerobic ribonucleoside-triphosphate reductase activating protein [Flavobacterium lacisediminis]|uniref:Anaerobic ribonucleoside-triphosphate reductase activating protein n=1 Tax=Flavobacterium lacisediminis TaxID=2989705 RepID=A0ABT3EKN5_9FLAO|nr:anaerobic ribonucleoside-triphosphate reductase activating protein [Flavobacterium lacisediminis]